MHSCMHSVTTAIQIVKPEIFNWTFDKRGQLKNLYNPTISKLQKIFHWFLFIYYHESILASFYTINKVGSSLKLNNFLNKSYCSTVCQIF